MMRRFALVLFALLPCLSHAQGTVTLTANSLRMGGGSAAVGTGSQMCVMTVDANNRPAGYRVGTAGQTVAVVGGRECHPITAGAIQPFQVIHSGNSKPQNACIRVTIEAANGTVLRTDPCVQTGTDASFTSGFCSQSGGVVTCNYDAYAAGSSPLAQVQAGPQGPQGATGATGCNTSNSSCSLSLTPQVLNSRLVNVDTYVGFDVGGRLVAAEAATTGLATYQINTGGTLSTDPSLPLGADLQINANLTITTAVTLNGSNRVFCAPGVTITSALPIVFYGAQNAGNIAVEGCHGIGTAATGDHMLLVTHKASNVRFAFNVTEGMGGVKWEGTGGYHMALGNILTGTSAGEGSAIVENGGSHASIVANQMKNFRNGIQIQNANVDFNVSGAPTTRAAVLALPGWYTVVANTGESLGDGIFYSGAHDGTASSNTFTNIGDVCLDLEGTADMIFSHNTCKNAANGVGSLFFFNDSTTFDGEDYSSSTGQTLIAIYNSSRDPYRNTNLRVLNSNLHCESVQCAAVGGNAAAGVIIQGNRIKNGRIDPNDYWIGTTIKGNRFDADVATGPPINLNQMRGGGVVEVDDNRIYSTFAQASTSSCSEFTNVDFNASVNVQFTNNRCSGYAHDWKFTSNSGNSGVGMFVTLDGNWDHADGASFFSTLSGMLAPGFTSRDQSAISSRMLPSGGVYRRVLDSAATLGAGSSIGENLGATTTNGFFVCSNGNKLYTKSTPCM